MCLHQLYPTWLHRIHVTNGSGLKWTCPSCEHACRCASCVRKERAHFGPAGVQLLESSSSTPIRSLSPPAEQISQDQGAVASMPSTVQPSSGSSSIAHPSRPPMCWYKRLSHGAPTNTKCIEEMPSLGVGPIRDETILWRTTVEDNFTLPAPAWETCVLRAKPSVSSLAAAGVLRLPVDALDPISFGLAA